MHQKSYDPEKGTGNILVNISLDLLCIELLLHIFMQ